ncbi:MAG: cysteine synthase [Candidatus Moranbacteria bacterium]|nr:cysteine synthase [Candidatus Moranbacteria bacterium]
MYQNILKTIGNTPIVKINHLSPKPEVKIMAKVEGVNPGGSIKDRVALRIIKEAEKTGELTAEKVIIEASSGNTGIAIAMIAAVKGYQAEIVMSEAVSSERQKMIKAFGAKLILTAKDKGTAGALERVEELIQQYPNKYFYTNQHSNQNNKIAHYKTTAKEIWQQTQGKIDYFVSAIGTSGTLMGVGSYLRKFNPKIKIVSAEPVLGHYIQGLRSMKEMLIPELYDRKALDEVILIETQEAWAMSRKITEKEGIFAGMSSGAALLAAIKVARKIKKGLIVTIFPDRGEKYLSTELFGD